MQYRIDCDDTGELDDVALTGVEMFRMERMSHNSIWIRLYRHGGDDIVFNVGSRDKIEWSGFEDFDNNLYPQKTFGKT